MGSCEIKVLTCVSSMYTCCDSVSCCLKCRNLKGCVFFLYKSVEASIEINNPHLFFSPFAQGRLGINTQQTEHKKIWLEETSKIIFFHCLAHFDSKSSIVYPF